MPKKAHVELFPDLISEWPAADTWLKAHLKGWHTLYRLIHSKAGTPLVLRAALQFESQQPRPRKLIMRRIIGRLTTLERNRLCKLLKITTP